MRDIEKLRKEIDNIDINLIDLLEKRGELAKEISQIKIGKNLEVYQPDREKKVIQNVKSMVKVLNPDNIESIWKEIMGACKVIQNLIVKVGYLGPIGTFTHQAAREFFPKAGTKFIACKNIEEIFEIIEKDVLEFGVVPIENSLQGTVRKTLDLLIEKNLIIHGEVELRIVQNLISIEGSDLSKIKNIYSHPQAFAQTKKWIKINLPNANLINTNSTSAAVQQIKELNKDSNAAIGTEFASEVYHLQILSSNIEDNPSNYTRFLNISKKENQIKEGKIKTSLVYITRHVPGALHKVLEIFAKEDINLMKIESRPRREGRWEYFFLMDFEGDKEQPKIKKVLEKINQNVIWYKILGSYPLI